MQQPVNICQEQNPDAIKCFTACDAKKARQKSGVGRGGKSVRGNSSSRKI